MKKIEKNIQSDDKCIGCGLCKAVYPKGEIELSVNKEGFIRPTFNTKDFELLEKVCPLLNSTEEMTSNTVWGKYISSYLGYSNDEEVRFKASSGGVITQLCIYLIEKKLVDGIIHIGTSNTDPIHNLSQISYTSKEVINNTGSRYAPAAPLDNLLEQLQENKTYCFIGKPCDIRALNNYLLLNQKIAKQIKYKISFFCGGTPSYLATDTILDKFMIKKSNLKEFWYRGNGWPGKTTAITKEERRSMPYEESWGQILGRNVQKYCRLCVDPIGEFADIACGDGWYLNSSRYPDFAEADGRNIILTRTLEGEKLIKEAYGDMAITLNQLDVNDIEKMQPYQYQRKATAIDKITAFKVMGKPTQNVSYKNLYILCWKTSKKVHLKVFLGTIKRILNGRI